MAEEISDRSKKTVLKAKPEAFCVAFVDVGAETFGHGTKSAIAADYSENSARTQAWRLLKNDDVKRRILELYDEKLKDNKVTTQSVLVNLAHDRLLARQAGQYSVAVHCTELEGKYLAMFSDKLVNVDPEKDAERQEFMESEQAELDRIVVQIRTDELAREPNKIIPFERPKTG